MFGLDHDDEYNSYSRLQEAREDAEMASEKMAEYRKKLVHAEAKLDELKHRQLNYYHATYGTIFWDQDEKIIKTLHEGDCEFRVEYLESLFSYFDIEPIYHRDKPDFITHEQLCDFGIEE